MEPKVQVAQETARRGPAPDRWQVRWRVENLGDRQLKILAARLPHGKFRSAETEFARAILIEPKQSGRIELEVRCNEPPGSIVENAFLIMRVLCADAPWLILARLRVSVNDKRAPVTAAELITAQPVGFSTKPEES